MAHEQLLRLFLAIELPATVRNALVRVQTRIKPIYDAGTYPKPENLHITMHFLGDTAVSRLPVVIDALSAIPMPILTLRLADLFYFPDARRARAAVAGLAGDIDLLSDLYDRQGTELKSLGFRLDHRKYTPHVTLARFKFPPKQGMEEAILAARSALESAGEFRVTQFTLFESTLDPKGAKYAPLGRLPRNTL